MNAVIRILLALFLLILPATAFAQASGQEYFEQGNGLYNQKKYDQAIASYGRAIQAQPLSLPKAYLNRARAYSMAGNYVASVQYYAFYESLDKSAAKDKKIQAEAKAVAKKAKGTYTRDGAQTTVLDQMQKALDAGGPYLTRQGNGAFAFYDVLVRSGFAEPSLYDLQTRLVQGIVAEIQADITPPAGQPLPSLDRTGWEFIRNKVARARQFADARPNEAFLLGVEALANAWEAYYRGDYDSAQKAFDAACSVEPRLPAAYWGRVMLGFQREDNRALLDRIDEAEAVYRDAGLSGNAHFFALLRAQAYRNLGNMDKSLEWLRSIHSEI